MHALLQRQIARILGRELTEEELLGGLRRGDDVEALVRLVSATYEALEEERGILERCLGESTREVFERSSRMREELLARTSMEVALRASEERYALALQGAHDGIWDWELPGRLLHLSARCFEMLGTSGSAGRMPISAIYRRIHPADRAMVRHLFAAHLADEQALLQVECRLRHADGDWRWILVRGAAVRDPLGQARRVAGSFSDVTARKQAEAQLVRASLHDRLTGLPNRGYFLDALQRVLARSRRRPEVRFAVAFADLDRLKVVNDTLGHQAGDELLAEFAARISGLVRAGDVVARLSGDEFAILLDQLSAPSDALHLAERVNAALERPIMVHGHAVFASASIGIVLSDAPGAARYESAEHMLRDADTAMYRAKALGRGRHALFDQAMHDQAYARLQLEADLARALPLGEVTVHYQPIVRLGSLEPVGVEALARWQHPTRGTIEASEFIPAAEESGMISVLGRHVLRVACVAAKAFAAEVEGGHLALSVNVSARQLLEADLADYVEQVLMEIGLAPELLALEITESTMLESPAAARATLARLRALKVGVHLDDFGTGYSSLSYLHRLDVDSIKIDRSFVTHAQSDGDAVLSSILLLSRRLGKVTVAEGIESEADLQMCRRLGCDLGQGFLLARPMDAEATIQWLRSRKEGVGSGWWQQRARPKARVRGRGQRGSGMKRPRA